MAARWDLVTLDSPDPDRAARFWRATLGLEECEREDDGRWIVLCAPGGARRLGLQRGPAKAGTVHLDLECDVAEFEAEVERLVSLGAALVAPARQEPYGRIANLADPDGNPFDLCAYG